MHFGSSYGLILFSTIYWNCSGQCLHGNMIKLVRNPNAYNLLIELYSEVNCLAQILVEDELNMSELGLAK